MPAEKRIRLGRKRLSSNGNGKNRDGSDPDYESQTSHLYVLLCSNAAFQRLALFRVCSVHGYCDYEHRLPLSLIDRPCFFSSECCKVGAKLGSNNTTSGTSPH